MRGAPFWNERPRRRSGGSLPRVSPQKCWVWPPHTFWASVAARPILNQTFAQKKKKIKSMCGDDSSGLTVWEPHVGAPSGPFSGETGQSSQRARRPGSERRQTGHQGSPAHRSRLQGTARWLCFCGFSFRGVGVTRKGSRSGPPPPGPDRTHSFICVPLHFTSPISFLPRSVHQSFTEPSGTHLLQPLPCSLSWALVPGC